MRPAILFGVCATALAVSPAAATTRSFPVSGFDKLSAEGPYTVHVRTGLRPSVEARGPQRRLDKLVVEVRNGTLVISTEKSMFGMNWTWGSEDRTVIDVTVPMLSAAALTGSGDVIVDRIKAPAFETVLTGSGNVTINQIDTGRLTATVTGSGDMTLSGHAMHASTAVRGSGDLKARGLTADTVNAALAGSGDLNMGPARRAAVSLAGSGDVTIAGRPQCTISKHGSGDVTCG